MKNLTLEPTKNVFLTMFLFLAVCVTSFSQLDSKVLYSGEEELNLNGQWDFYWQEFTLYNQVTSFKPLIPSSWNSYEDAEGNTLPGKGYGTYHLTIIADKEYSSSAFKIPNFHNAYNFYLNGEKIYSRGSADTTENGTVPGYGPKVKRVSFKKGRNEIYIHIANFRHPNGGFTSPLYVGQLDRIVSIERWEDFTSVLMVGSLIFIGLFFLSMFMYWQKDKAILYYGLFALTFALRTSIYKLEVFTRFVPSFPWTIDIKLEYISFYMSWFFLYHLISHLLTSIKGKLISKIFSWICLLVSAITLLTPLNIYARLLNPYIVLAVIFITYIFVMYVMNIKRTTKISLLSLLTGLVLIVTIIVDFLIYLQIIKTTFPFTNLLYLASFLVFATEMARRFALSFSKVESLNNEIKNLERLKTKWIANITHELKTPLTLIKGPIGVLEKTDSENQADRGELLSIAKNNIERLEYLISEILDLSKLEEGKLKLFSSHFNLHRALVETIHSFNLEAEQKGIRIKLDTPKSTLLNADRERLTKVVNNLISNAIKHSLPDSQIIISTEESIDRFTIQVKDFGQGIPEEEIEKIFDRFYQATNNLSVGGSGIGLSLSRELIEMHGGTISVESKIGCGSLFKIVLPLAFKSTDNQEPVFIEKEILQTTADEVSSVSMSKPSILLVEDNVEMRIYITSFLKFEYDIKEAIDGEEAIAMLENFIPDLIISDVMMPRVNGIELAHFVKQQANLKAVPFIILTAVTNEQDKLDTLRIGVDDYLNKPFSAEELQIRIGNLLLNKKSRLEDVAGEALQSFDDKLVSLLKQTITDNIASSILSVSFLADAVSMSERQLQRYLKKHTGFSPVKFINEIKLLHAESLLIKKVYPTLKEVTYAIGLEQSTYFSNLFEKRFGKKPSEYFK